MTSESEVMNETNNDGNSIAAPTFDLTKPFEFSVPKKTPKGTVNIFHRLRHASYKELEAKDAAQPYRSRDIGNDREEPILDLTNKSDTKLYDALILETRGYKFNVAEGQTPEERQSALTSIPNQHKVEIIGAILKFNSKVDYEDGADETIETFVWGENIEYRIKTLIGAGEQFTAFITMREPTEKQMSDYRRDTTQFVIEKGQQKPVTEVSVKLKPAVELFNELVVKVEGVTINGQPFDTANVEHVALLNAYMKRSAVDAMMKALQLDLGN